MLICMTIDSTLYLVFHAAADATAAAAVAELLVEADSKIIAEMVDIG